MKKIQNILLVFVLSFLGFFGLFKDVLATDEPNTIKSGDSIITEDFIEGAPRVYYKPLDSGIWVYCENENKTYLTGYTMKKFSKVDDGYIYILENKPNTGNSQKDYYVMQIAVWWYQDLLDNRNTNLTSTFKKYVLDNASTNELCKMVYNLVKGAKSYKQEGTHSVKFDASNVTFKLDGENYVSSDIKVTYANVKLDEVILKNMPEGAKVINLKDVNGGKTFNVSVPKASIKSGEEVTFKVVANTSYSVKSAYDYYFNNDWQRVLYGKVISDSMILTDTLTLKLKGEVVPPTPVVNKYDVLISKTDATGKLLAGATLKLTGNGTDLTFVSTTSNYKVELLPGEYTLTENVAPKGYILNKEAVSFKVDENGKVYQKNVAGAYVLVDSVKMVNVLRDSIMISKLDSESHEFVVGARLLIETVKGEKVVLFTTTNDSYYVSLEEGDYVLSEEAAPNGYILNTNKIYFKVDANGSVFVRNEENGIYEKANGIIFYNTPVQDIPDVPQTGISSTLTYIVGSLLLVSGAYLLVKNEKKC